MKSLAAAAKARSVQKARSTMKRLSEEKRTRSDFHDKWISGSNSSLKEEATNEAEEEAVNQKTNKGHGRNEGLTEKKG